jgi:1,4-dihydroxy-2-naphthoate polyprenyltransferase
MMTAPSVPAASDANQPPAWKLWWLAARPKTLPASIAPILVGTGVAIHVDGFHALTALLALLTALLLQTAANFANDVLDFKRGADTAERTGPTRITSSGLVTPEKVLWATGIALALATLTGLYLVWRGGWPFLVLGIAALVCAVAYTGGPFPLAYLGLGEVFVFLFFGPIAVTGTAYLQTLDLTALSIAAAIPSGAMAVAILVVNNVRDLEQDSRAGKRTVAVRIGRKATIREYVLMLQLTLLVPFVFWLGGPGWLNAWALLTVLAWPLFWDLWRQIPTRTGPALNATLGATGRASLVFSVLLFIALILGT